MKSLILKLRVKIPWLKFPDPCRLHNIEHQTQMVKNFMIKKFVVEEFMVEKCEVETSGLKLGKFLC